MSNSFIFRAALTAILVAVATSVWFAPDAYAITYSTSGTSELFSLGDQLGTSSDYDQLTVNGASGTLTTGTIKLNTFDFTAGVNAYVPATYTYSFNETMTVSNGGGTQTLTVPFNISINTADTISILGGNSLTFAVGNNDWDIVVNALTIGPNAGGTMIANLTATVTDPPGVTPLPGTLVLFASGIGIIGWVGWRKRQNNSISRLQVPR